MSSLQGLAPIHELRRLSSPGPAPQSLATDGRTLWVGSRDTNRISAIDAESGTLVAEVVAPGTPRGSVLIGNTLHVVCSVGVNDDRVIRRYVVGRGFDDDNVLACPEATGSFLGYDGTALYLSQFYKGRILELDAAGSIVREILVGAQICGFVFVEGTIYLLRGTEDPCDWRFARLNLDEGESPWDLASVPFQARSLVYDGRRFWTNDRAHDAIVAFASLE